MAGFLEVAEHVDRAQRALLAAVPTPRDDGVELPAAIEAFLIHLDAAAQALRAWGEASEAHRMACGEAVARARHAARRLLAHPEGLSFEALNARIGDVLHPLEDVADVERALRRGN